MGVDMIELDVQLTRDSELVVMHDLELARTTNGRGAVREHTLAELKRLDAGAWFDTAFSGEPVLTLDEVLDIVTGRTRLNVEIKVPREDWAALAVRLVATLHARRRLASTVVSCFDPEALVAVREQSNAACLGLLWQHTDFAEAWTWVERLRAASLHPHWMLISADVVQIAHHRGVDVLAWTVNDVAAMEQLVAHGVDGIMSDFPERFSLVAALGR